LIPYSRYLLSDNRHYIHYFGSAIYVWWPWLKFALIPLYIFGWTWILRNLEGSVPFKAALVLSIALSVVPQLLMEFRYFVPGFIFIRLHLRAFKWKDMAGEFLLYAIVNYLTFNQFLYQSWETSTGTQRIMW
jgi:alpha-1,2-glucosyltransferase